MNAGKRLNDQERVDWLRLIRSENVGPVTFFDLLERYGTAAKALEALPELAERGGRRNPLRICTPREAEREIATAQKRSRARLVAIGEPDYPVRLGLIPMPPPLIYMAGEPTLAQRQAVAIVGSRNASAAGRKLTQDIARGLSAEGIAVISGLARGIDASAHEGALEGGTIAVLAGGIDIRYPPENETLYGAIAEQGLLIAESAPGFKPRGVDFPRRNRIISGMASGVLVVEAARRSGSMVTARHAGEQGRDVMAVPGHPLDPRAEGPNALLKDGAALIRNADDVLEALRAAEIFPEPQPSLAGFSEPDAAPFDLDDRARQQVTAALSPVPIEIDELIRMTGLSARAVAVVLMELELAGRITREGRRSVALTTD
ncbi:DNA-processing protein DprA [Dichotomicrobium thermohalophilum]|uniref:DNA processing protein n=1 Tax=Dichotomicrobium thermohalophilum TaxID=933063 RepID=A0A397PMT3_9HYPH|nr:DNA-processing protein DprA [Dichotomicrobium thermohalophilum]RIA47424.1 DNA processing protein [Dichotomicrobium thermohalophilum]